MPLALSSPILRPLALLASDDLLPDDDVIFGPDWSGDLRAFFAHLTDHELQSAAAVSLETDGVRRQAVARGCTSTIVIHW